MDSVRAHMRGDYSDRSIKAAREQKRTKEEEAPYHGLINFPKLEKATTPVSCHVLLES